MRRLALRLWLGMTLIVLPVTGVLPGAGARKLAAQQAPGGAAQQAPGGAARPAGPGAAPAAQASPAAAPSSPPAMAIQSWLTDHRKLAVGDVVTVLVDEYTLATADRTNSASQDRSTDAHLAGAFGTGAAAGTVVNGTLGTGLSSDSKQSGQSRHQDRVTAEITVRVTKIEAGGLLRVEGRKLLRIDGHDQQVALSGLLRPEDVSSQNVVDSWRLADAQVQTVSDNKLGAPKKGILSKLLGGLWP